MTKTLTVEGDLAAVDTRYNLTTQGSVTAPSLVIPAGVKKIDKIIVAAGSDMSAAGSGVFFIRLGGPAVMKGEQVIAAVGAGIIAVQAGSDQPVHVCTPFILENADIEVSPSDTISIACEMAGNDLGTGYAVVTLVFA